MKRYIYIAVAVLVAMASVSVTAQMMGGRGMMGRGPAGRGPGMMGWGMMGPGGGPWDYIPPRTVESLTSDEAAEQVELYLETWGNPDLELAEVMEFSNHFYAEVEEESTGVHAFELLVNKYTGQIFPEPGPNMMWNTKYGHMGGGMMGMMGGPWNERARRYRWQDPTAPLKLKPEQAVQKAQKFLDSLYPGIKADKEVDAFYGYYTIHTMKDGKTYGMLSVNGYTGDVWYHTWHGRFVGMKEFEEGKKEHG